MPPLDIKLQRWQIVTGYVAFGVFAFIFSLYVTFPYDAVKQRLVAEAAKMGLHVRIDSMGPGFFGVTASGLQVSKKIDDAATKAPEPLHIRSLALRPSLFPLGASIRAKAFGGTISGAVGGLGTRRVKLEMDGLNPTEGNLKAFSGLDLEGRVGGELDLSIPQTTVGKSKEPDLAQATGTLDLKLEQMLLKGGSINIASQGGEMGLPRIPIGELAGKIKFDKGAGTIESLNVKSADLEIKGSGTLKLARQLPYSEMNLEFKIKVEPGLTKDLGFIGMGLGVLPPDRENSAFRVARITGFLSSPRFPLNR